MAGKKKTPGRPGSGRSKGSTKAEIKRRLRRVEDLMLQGRSNHHIARLLSDEFGVERRSIRLYMREVYEDWEANGLPIGDRDGLRRRRLRTLEVLADEAWQSYELARDADPTKCAQHLRNVLKAHEQMAKIEGTNAPAEINLSGAVRGTGGRTLEEARTELAALVKAAKK